MEARWSKDEESLQPSQQPALTAETPSATLLSPHGPELIHEVRLWPEQRVCYWLTSINMRHYNQVFIDNNINGECLLECNKETLKDIGVQVVGDRVKIYNAIKGILRRGSLIMGQKPPLADTSSPVTFEAKSAQILEMPAAAPSRAVIHGDESAVAGTGALRIIHDGGHMLELEALPRESLRTFVQRVLDSLALRISPDETSFHVVQSDGTTRKLALGELDAIFFDMERPERSQLILVPSLDATPQWEDVNRAHAIHEALAQRKVDSSRQKQEQPAKDYKAKPEIVRNTRLKDYFGQRPPSELISSNLSEYFPNHQHEVLEKTMRNSIRFSRQFSRVGSMSSARSSMTGSLFASPGNADIQSHRGSRASTLSFAHPVKRYTQRSSVIHRDNDLEEADEEEEEATAMPDAPNGENGNETHKPSSGVQITASDRDSVIDTFLEAGEGSDDNGVDDRSDSMVTWIKGALIGSGSFGNVFLGMNSLSGELMAVKQVELDIGADEGELANRKKSMMNALEHEIQLLRDLSHPNIVQYLGSQTDEQHMHIFLEYVPGGSVAALLQGYGKFGEPLMRNFVRQICCGLEYLHGRGIVHRDIKGANILVDNKGGVKISDFGISRKMENSLLSLTQSEIPGNRISLQGSVYWMAPEVVKQTSYTSKADIWSLGCLVIEMATGQHPFPNFSQMQALFKIGTMTKPEIPQDLSEEARDFLAKALEIDFRRRPTASELLGHKFVAQIV